MGDPNGVQTIDELRIYNGAMGPGSCRGLCGRTEHVAGATAEPVHREIGREHPALVARARVRGKRANDVQARRRLVVGRARRKPLARFDQRDLR